MKTANEHYEDGYTQGALEANDEIDRVKAQLDALRTQRDALAAALERILLLRKAPIRATPDEALRVAFAYAEFVMEPDHEP